MRLIVLDTNVVVSSGLKPLGLSARLVLDWVFPGLVRIVTCPTIIAEYRDVSLRPKFARYAFPPEWLDKLIESSFQLPDPPSWLHDLPDPTDAPFLALAKMAGAWLITGNLKHFPTERRHGVTVLPPAEYLARLEKGRPTLESG